MEEYRRQVEEYQQKQGGEPDDGARCGGDGREEAQAERGEEDQQRALPRRSDDGSGGNRGVRSDGVQEAAHALGSSRRCGWC